MSVPTKLDYLVMLEAMGAITQRASADVQAERATEIALIGAALSALYQAATCHRKCRGGSHILEALSGRTYNLGASAYLLIIRGYYDEALNLVRSIGEISNLIALSAVDKDGLREWLESDKKTRLRKFSPAQVRRILERQGRDLMLADSDWYSRFCETYTHVTPDTKPNMHNDADKPFVGGAYQPNGLRSSLAELATALGVISMMVCAYFGLDDLFEEISAIVDDADKKSSAQGSH
jgi:hypothetical protein